MSFKEGMPSGRKSVAEELSEAHGKAQEHLGAAYDEVKVDAIAAVRGWDVVLSELAALPAGSDPADWYKGEENAECIEMFKRT